jgi:hypothetical protein
MIDIVPARAFTGPPLTGASIRLGASLGFDEYVALIFSAIDKTSEGGHVDWIKMVVLDLNVDKYVMLASSLLMEEKRMSLICFEFTT